MDNLDVRTRQLQQIPVFALRHAVIDLLDDPGMEPVLRARLREVARRFPRDLKRAVGRLTREQLTRLINACPEINDSGVQELFEEYRYGTSPSFNVYLFDAKHVAQGAWQGFRSRFEAALEEFNKPLEEGLARLRRLRLDDLISLPDRPEINEAKYRFQARLDYVDEDENVVSVYQSLYGFFWVNTAAGYAIIQARGPEVLSGLRRALEMGAGIVLEPLVISKHLKNELTFLSKSELRSSRLYDPDPQTDRFRWLTITDDEADRKGYDQWEERYPEVRNLRYRETVGQDRETSLTIRCDQAAFGLAGKLKASEFRAWCLDRLDQLITTLDRMKLDLPHFVETHSLANMPEMSEFDQAQKEHILRIISALLTVKQSPDLGEQPVGAVPLQLAAALGSLVGVLVHYDHPTLECEEEEDLVCPECGGRLFTITHSAELWTLACQAGKKTHWTATLPLLWHCLQGHEFSIGENEVAQGIILLPSEKLSQSIRRIVNQRLPGYRFDPDREGFLIRGPNLIYYRDRKQITSDVRTEINLFQNVGSLAPGANMVGVSLGQVAGPVSVRGSTVLAPPQTPGLGGVSEVGSN